MIPKLTILATSRSSFDSSSCGFPRPPDEGGADLAAEVGADGDRLQVRVRGREPSGRRDGLVEGRVEATVVLRDEGRERHEVRVQELRVLAPLLEHVHDRVLVAGRAGGG